MVGRAGPPAVPETSKIKDGLVAIFLCSLPKYNSPYSPSTLEVFLFLISRDIRTKEKFTAVEKWYRSLITPLQGFRHGTLNPIFEIIYIILILREMF